MRFETLGTRFARAALLAGLASMALSAQADREALVVGVGKYPAQIVHSDGYHKTVGVHNDVVEMTRLLHDLYGFHVASIENTDAKKKKIVDWLTARASGAKSGDDFVLYFSGLGSLGHAAGEANLVGTLVPYDAVVDNSSGDISMADLASYAGQITSRGAHITYVVDASYTSPALVAKSFEGKHWIPSPKCFDRTRVSADQVRRELYLSTNGAMLAACGPLGAAYELQQNEDPDSAQGAFSSILEEGIYDASADGITAHDAMVQVSLQFKAIVSDNYLKGQDPAAPLGAGVYDLPVFTSQKPDISKFPGLPTILQRRASRLKSLQVDIDMDQAPGDEGNKKIAQIRAAIETPGSGMHVTGFGQFPDRVLHLDPNLDTITLKGGEAAIKPRSYSIKGGDLNLVAMRLEENWQCLRLARYVAKNKGPLGPKWVAKSDSARWDVGDSIQLDLTSPVAGYFVGIAVDDSEGLYEVWQPQPLKPTLNVQTGDHMLDSEMKLTADDTSGTTMLTSILLPADFPWSMPPPLPDRQHVTLDQLLTYEKSLLQILRGVNDWVENPAKSWGAFPTTWIFAP